MIILKILKIQDTVLIIWYISFIVTKKETYNKNMLIEIQFRTKLQHIWATAVEMMGIYTKSNLKSSKGNKDVLRFFVLVSSIFAKMENMPICSDTIHCITP